MSEHLDEQQDALSGREERVTISRAALRLELLQMEVRLKDFMAGRLSTVEKAVAELQAINAQRDSTVAAMALETERRRVDMDRLRTERADALQVPLRTWQLRTSKVGMLVAAMGVGMFLLGLWNAIH